MPKYAKIIVFVSLLAILLSSNVATVQAQTYEYTYSLTFDTIPDGWTDTPPFAGSCAVGAGSSAGDVSFLGGEMLAEADHSAMIVSDLITGPMTFTTDTVSVAWGSNVGQGENPTYHHVYLVIGFIKEYPDCSVGYLMQAYPDDYEETFGNIAAITGNFYLTVYVVNTWHIPSYTDGDAYSGITYVDFHVTTSQPSDPFVDAGLVSQPYGYRPLVDDDIYSVNHVSGYGPIVDDVYSDRGDTVYNSFTGQVVFLQVENGGYTIKVVEAGTDRYALYSNLETAYPKLNDIIYGGCAIGTVGESFKDQFYSSDPGLLWYYTGTDFYDFDNNEYINWQSEYSEPEPTGTLCGSTLRTDHCINYNPHMDELATGWVPLYIEDYDIYWSSVHLSSYQSSISQYMSLDHTEDYYLTIAYEDFAEYDTMWVITFAATTNEIIDTIIETIDYTETPDLVGTRQIVEVGPIDLTDYDSNDLYLVSIMSPIATTAGHMWIDDVCIHTGNATVTNQYCYFDNWQLDGSAGWDSDGYFGNNPGTYDSSVILEPDEYLSQAISLISYDGEDADYALTVGARVTGNDLGDLVDIITTGWEADFAQEVWSAGPVLELDIGDVTVDNAIIYLARRTEFTVDDGTTLVGDLTITADSGNTKDLQIDYVCLNPVTGVWPGSDEDDLSGNTKQACSACSVPTGLTIANFPEWLNWLWCNLYNFFTCTLALWLASIAGWLLQMRDLLGLFGRYLAACIGLYSSWIYNLITSLASALLDALQWALSVLWNALADLNLLRYLFDLIGYLIAIALALQSLGQYIFGLIYQFLATLINLGHLIGTFFTSLSLGLSGSVADITVPSCDTPNGIYIGFCLVFVMVDGVFAEFPALSIGIILDAALIAFFTIVWTVQQMGDAFADV